MGRLASCLVALAIVAVVLAGCYNSGCTNCYGAAPCRLPTGMQAALIYPAPGSTGNPVSLPQVVFATSGTLPTDWANWDVILTYVPTGAYSGQVIGGTVTAPPSPVPTPTATAPFPSPTYWSSSFNYGSSINTPMPPGFVITATLNDLSSSCYPGVAFGQFGT